MIVLSCQVHYSFLDFGWTTLLYLLHLSILLQFLLPILISLTFVVESPGFASSGLGGKSDKVVLDRQFEERLEAIRRCV